MTTTLYANHVIHTDICPWLSAPQAECSAAVAADEKHYATWTETNNTKTRQLKEVDELRLTKEVARLRDIAEWTLQPIVNIQ